MKSDIEYGSSDKRDWLANHTLSKEQVRQLILNKIKRAEKSQKDLETVRSLVKYTD